jgi:diguanylate cyclase (GGDEF)-like protein
VAEIPDAQAVWRLPRFEPELEAQFRSNRAESLADVNPNTFWAIAVIVLAFSGWDAILDPAHWRAALYVRLIGVAVVVASGVYQKLPGRRLVMPSTARLRFVAAVATTTGALGMLDHGLEEGVAGLVAIFLIAPYIAIDRIDLLLLNLVALTAVAAIAFGLSLDRFTAFNVALHLLLAVVVSQLLGRVLETSNRRAFLLEVKMIRDARTDALTGVANRRAIDERATLELRRAERSGAPIAVIIGDIDHFKKINDRHGHYAGDGALRTAADALRSAMRQIDAIGRWGGEEFIAVLPDTDATAAAEVAERMRRAVQSSSFSGIPEGLTISLGVAAATVAEATPAAWTALVKAADDSLYQAKSDGRNRVAIRRSAPVSTRESDARP